MYCITADKAGSEGVSTDIPGVAKQGTANAIRDESSAAKPRATVGRSPESEQASTAATTPQARAEAEGRMGEKLLLGWTMLADECPTPDCCFPLMRDRERKVICIACGQERVEAVASVAAAPVVRPSRDTSSSIPRDSGTAPVAAAPVQPAASVGPDSSEGELGTQGVLSAADFAATRKKRDRLSASLGHFMLQGWSLLDKNCPRQECEPGTPLLRDRATDVMYCAGCDTHFSKDGQEILPTQAVALPVKRNSSGENRNSVAAVEIGHKYVQVRCLFRYTPTASCSKRPKRV